MYSCVPCHREGKHEVRAYWRVWPDAGPWGTSYTFMCNACCAEAIYSGMTENMLGMPVDAPVKVAQVSLIIGDA